MWGNLHDHSIFWNMSQAFLEQDWADKVIHMVLSRRVLSQIALPLRFRDGSADPAGGTRLWTGNNLEIKKMRKMRQET